MSKKTKSKSVKGKVISGYILLFLVGAVSIGFLYNEILKANRPKDDVISKNQQLLNLSDALATLYAAESSGRSANIVSSEKNFNRYNNMIDSAIVRMQSLKKLESELRDVKLDSITELLLQKKKSIAKIRHLNHQYSNESNFAAVKTKLLSIRDSLRKSTKRVDLTKSNRAIEREFGEFMSDLLSEQEKDSLSRPFISDTDLLAQYDKTLSELIAREDKLKNELKEKENSLQLENQVLSNKIQILLASLEKEILDKSYADMQQGQERLERTTLALLWIGVLGVLLLLVFGWIILRDLTKQQQYRQQLEVLNNQNSMLLRSKTMLIATVTHDLQTPLGSILGFSDLLKKTPLDQTQNQYVSNISNSSDYIRSLVNDLVDFSKLENNRIKIQKVPFNPKKLIESTFNSLKQNAVDKDIMLLYDVEDSLDINVLSDPYRAKQILTNLVTNAIKFTPKGYVKIVGKKLGNDLIFEVHDTGIGISEEAQKYIFEEFTQANPDIEKQFGGTGLGLTISKRMVELLNGEIWVSSEVDKGSVFGFSIPYIEDEIVDTIEAEKLVDSTFLKGKKILVVDDDKMQLSLIEALFSGYSVELKTLNDATQVIPLLEKEYYDIVFTDIQMPKKSGFKLVEKIRKHPKQQVNNIPVIALSGKRDLSIEDFTQKGFTYFIEKPLNMKQAIAVMDFVFNGKSEPIAQKSDVPKTQKLYDLSSLTHFLSDDKQAIQNIINVFVDSTKSSIDELQSNKNDVEKLSQIAHRMIPMLKQIESFEIVGLLENLEDKKIPKQQLNDYVLELTDKLKFLNNQLQNQTNND